MASSEQRRVAVRVAGEFALMAREAEEADECADGAAIGASLLVWLYAAQGDPNWAIQLASAGGVSNSDMPMLDELAAELRARLTSQNAKW